MSKKICSVEDCDRETYCKGMCERHYRQVKKHGKVIDGERKESFINRVGEEKYNKWGSLMRIIEYKNANDMIIEFQDEYKIRKSAIYKNFKEGNIKNPYDKTIYGVGYLGEGKYNLKNYRTIYDVWNGMLERCYDPYTINKHITYKDCYVCKEWHNFQNFAQWWEENVYNCNNERMELDKDILIKGNKVYSPETCLIVPKRINQLFVKSDASRGNFPIGVSFTSDKTKLETRCCTLKGSKYLGRFPINKPFQAFTAYKNFKENYIKKVADEYKSLIPTKLYEALYKYEVEIND